MQFLHCFDLSDKLKCLNFCSRNVIESLFSLQLINNDTKPNPRDIGIENLIDCQPEHINGISSPRMWLIYKASLYRKLDRSLTSEEQIIVKKADLEITFEKIRRLINFGALTDFHVSILLIIVSMVELFYKICLWILLLIHLL